MNLMMKWHIKNWIGYALNCASIIRKLIESRFFIELGTPFLLLHFD
ncbi:unnamed protein product [Gongylonema pulchrum]|uniref:Uncharacterized protein n=1 Tax=Gongylonema pulchrum TaxID=637853 RepID=A0A183F141_9BILA|nr:unnamed protein product [Gongylonema pulchrum]